MLVVERALASSASASGHPRSNSTEADGRSPNARGDGECRGGEESGRRTHPDVRVRDIALRVRAVLDVRRVRLERRRRHLHAPPSAAAAAHGARLARTRVPVRSTLRGNQNRGTPDGASSVLTRGRAPPAPAFAARARLARGRGLYHPSTLGGGTLCRQARRVETAPLRCRLSENIAKTGLRAPVNGVSEFPTPSERPSGGDGQTNQDFRQENESSMMGLIPPYTRIFRTPTEGVDSKSEKPRLARRASHADVWRGTCARTRVRSTPLELWRVFSTWRGFPSPGPSPARSSARPPPRRASRTRASPSSRCVPFGVPTFSRRETAESRPPTPVARAAARRATAANARGGARAFDDGVRRRVECLEMALEHPRTRTPRASPARVSVQG
jgi:hypothetical protein